MDRVPGLRHDFQPAVRDWARHVCAELGVFAVEGAGQDQDGHGQ
jgi:hypothetical protein